MYKYIDEIPAKLYFKVVEGANFDILKKYIPDFKNLSDDEKSSVWDDIQDEHDKINPSHRNMKILNIWNQMESLNAKYNSVILAIEVLRNVYDVEMYTLLKEQKYPLRMQIGIELQDEVSMYDESLQDDLDRIEKNTSGILDKIEIISKRLPVKKSKTSKRTEFDENVLGYAAINNSGFINTNRISVTQYYALINLGNEKLKELKRNHNGNNKKTNTRK